MRRVCVLLAALSVVPMVAQGQIGRIRRAVTDRVTGNQPAAQAQQNVVVPITRDVVTRYLNGMKARRDAMRNMARGNTESGRYFAAVLLRDSLQQRKNEFDAQSGPDFARYQEFVARLQNGDTTAAWAMSQLTEEINPHRVRVPEASWESQKKANDSLEVIARVAAGFEPGEWMYIQEAIPRAVSMMSEDGARDDSTVRNIARSTNISAEEVRLLREHRVDLAKALGMEWRTREERDRAAKEAERQQTEGARNTYAGCMNAELEPIQAEAERRKDELEAAQRNGDTAKLVEFANRVGAANVAAMQKCAPLQGQ